MFKIGFKNGVNCGEIKIGNDLKLAPNRKLIFKINNIFRFLITRHLIENGKHVHFWVIDFLLEIFGNQLILEFSQK